MFFIVSCFSAAADKGCSLCHEVVTSSMSQSTEVFSRFLAVSARRLLAIALLEALAKSGQVQRPGSLDRLAQWAVLRELTECRLCLLLSDRAIA